MADLRLFDQRTGRYVDALYAVLVASDEMQFFPELYEIFGEKNVVSFLDIFAGQTIVVPPRDVLEAKIRDVSMWLDASENGEEAVSRLADDHGLTEEEVRAKIGSISEYLNRVGVQACSAVKSAEKVSAHST